jgi:hypothetical protein
MKIIVGDLWNQPNGLILVPTNLTVDRTGSAVMGQGVARQAATLHRSLPREYGKELARGWKWPMQWRNLILFPTKDHWSSISSLDMIDDNLDRVIRDFTGQAVNLPLLGCGFGMLPPIPVLTLLAEKLDNWFTLILKNDTTRVRHLASLKREPAYQPDSLSESYQGLLPG